MTWSQLADAGDTHLQHAIDCETQGFRMLSWPLLRHLRDNEGYDTIIGPSAFETEPTFEHWVIAKDWRAVSTESTPLVLLDAFGQQNRHELLLCLHSHPAWAVIADPKLLSINSAAALEASGAIPSKFYPLTTNNLPVQKVYLKGWWRSGAKAYATGKQLTIWRKGLTPTSTLFPDRYALQVPFDHSITINEGYLHHTPSGRYMRMFRDSTPLSGVVIWTDGSRRNVLTKGGSLELSVGGGAFCVNTKLCFSIKIGGEPVAPRGEMGAIAHAVQTTPYNQPLCILTNSLSTLQILKRWRCKDFGPWASREKHWDILKVLLEHLSLRTAPTTFIWVKAKIPSM